MKNKVITTLLGLSLLVVPAAHAKNNFDRFVNLATLSTLATAVGGACIAGYKLYTKYLSNEELKKEISSVKQENNALKEQVVNLEVRVSTLETTQRDIVSILKTIQGQNSSFMSSITNLWNSITGSKKIALKA